MRDWEIRETPGREQPFTLWHHGPGDRACVGTPHVHKFSADREVCEGYIRRYELRYAVVHGG